MTINAAKVVIAHEIGYDQRIVSKVRFNGKITATQKTRMAHVPIRDMNVDVIDLPKPRNTPVVTSIIPHKK